MTLIKIAVDLLTTRGLQIGPRVYELAEIELYLNSKEHPDIYTHTHPDQQRMGSWYFHRTSAKPEAKYKGGTFKGLDLTLGNGEYYFGVLIRSIYHPDIGMITGPCNVVNHILSEFKAASIDDFVGKHGPLSVTDNPHKFHLVILDPTAVKTWNDEPIHVGPRVGLSDKASAYRTLPYRFCRRVKLIKKDKSSLKPLGI